MHLNIWLPWFPIVLAAGVGAALLGNRRGMGLGVLCAMFWVSIVHAGEGLSLWADGWSVVMLASGSLAIVAIAGWSAEGLVSQEWKHHRAMGKRKDDLCLPPRDGSSSQDSETSPIVKNLTVAIEQFDDWLESHRNDTDPWPEFGEFVRRMLYQCCSATHVRMYRILSEGDELVPIRSDGHSHTGMSDRGAKQCCDSDWRSARVGLIGHVATTGRSYLCGDTSHGELIERLAADSNEPLAWVFPVSRGARRIGVVTVGQVGAEFEDQSTVLRSIERLVCLFWNSLGEACRGRSADTRDPASGLLTREAFFASADHALQQSYSQGEPAVVAVIALEQLRHLNDTGRWDVADELVREVAALLQRKVRSDDHLGRFDGTRFMILLRRVDSHLATLILDQLMVRLTTLCGDSSRWGVQIQGRCGVSGSGTEKPELTAMVAQALRLCREARISEVKMASDLDDKGASLPPAREAQQACKAGESS